ncbi:MAG: hypothetical protein U0V73_01920 [Acidimicrobiia bacterium]
MPVLRRTGSAVLLVSTLVVVTACAVAPSGTPGPGTTLGSCPVFPVDNAWNRDVSAVPVDPASDRYVADILAHGGSHLHADFGGGGAYGIPFTTVGSGWPKLPVRFTAYGDESDPGPYPVPLDAPVEGGPSSDGDRHVITVDTSECRLYELYRAFARGDHWDADSGAVFDLRSNATRPLGWTSADAAGLPILAGLTRYDEVARGRIDHALRFTVAHTQRAYVEPATHFASNSTDASAPPMGLRLRLKATFDRSAFHGQARVILDALARYGMIVADNGSNWFISGDVDPRWDDGDLNQLKAVPGSAFEVVEAGTIHH